MHFVDAGNVSEEFSVGMQSAGLVLKDADNRITESEQLGSEQSGLANINIENSTDVIIGPVTQFHGPVTIYQSLNGLQTIEASATNESTNFHLNGSIKSSTSKTTVAETKQPKFFQSYLKCLKYVAIPITIVVIVTITLLVVFLKKSELSTLNPNTTTPSPLGSGIVINKSTWGGRPAQNWTTPLQHPTPFVLLSHTVSPQCQNFQECSDRVKSIQNFHVGSGKSPDIGYNFLIGGDGNAYEGRGWDIKNFHSAKTIGISFIGNYVYDELTPKMIEVTQKLIKEGVVLGKLDKNYKLICHNQTYETVSPGPNVYKVVKTWPHFDSGNYIEIS